MFGFFLEPHQAQAWSPTNKDPSITFTGLTIQGGGQGTGNWCSATTGQRLVVAQKIYYEITVNSTEYNNCGIGVANINATLENYCGYDNNGVGLYFGGGISYQGTQTYGFVVPNVGDVLCCALDGVNQAFYFRTNNGVWNGNAANNPATNTGGFACGGALTLPIYIAYCSPDTTESMTLNAGSTPFAQTPPLGFRAANSCSTS